MINGATFRKQPFRLQKGYFSTNHRALLCEEHEYSDIGDLPASQMPEATKVNGYRSLSPNLM